MAFPQTVQDIDVEMSFDAGTTWSSIVSPTNYVQRDGLITINRGRKGEANDVEPTEIDLTLLNTDGRFTPGYPLGAYYNSIGRNSQLRVSVPDSGVTLRVPGDITSKVSCPDAAGLGITGDLDVRADVSLLSWRAPQNIAGKWEFTADQRSWLLHINRHGQLVFSWSTDGTLTTSRAAVSTSPVTIPAGHRLAIRATIDVNNGAAGNTVTFYTSTSISGTWTQLGSAVTQSGTTSIFDSTSSIEIGSRIQNGVALSNGDAYNLGNFEAADSMTGRVYAFKLLSGIAGTEVANPDFTAQTAGATSFADTVAAPNTWTLSGTTLSDRDYRGTGEIVGFPQRWDTTGTYVTAPVTAAGVLRRLGATGTDQTAGSALYRFFMASSSDTGLVHYWPCEELAGSTLVSAATDDTPDMVISGSPQFATSDVFDCSNSVLTMSNASLTVSNLPVPTATSYSVRFLMRMEDAGAPDGATVARFYLNGDPGRIDMIYNTASGGTLKVSVYRPDGTLVHTTGGVAPSNGITNNEVLVSLVVDQSGANVNTFLYVYQLSDWDTAVSSGTSPTATVGGFTWMRFGYSLNLNQVAIGHISVHTAGTSSFQEAYQAHIGERAGRRFERICGEEGIAFRRWGNLDTTMAMGPQNVSSVMTILTECQDADGAMIYEPKDVVGLGYRTRESMYNQASELDLNYTAAELGAEPEPIDDDRYTVNDASVQRLRGSERRYRKTSGTLNVNAPGTASGAVGTYQHSFSLNLNSDDDAYRMAGWLVGLGTVDEQRWPSLSVNLANPRIAADTALVAQAAAIDVGELMTLSNMPIWIPQQTVTQLVQGYTETLGNYERFIRFDTAPASPWKVGVVSDTTQGRSDTAGSELVSAVTSTATSFTVYTSVDPIWTKTSAEYPFGLLVGGERVTATACTSGVSDAFGRTTSNGWGSADVGGTYTASGGSASDYSVGSGYGSHLLASTDVSRRTYLTSPGADTDTYLDITTSALATGASLFGALAARYVDVNNMYMARLEFTTANAIILSVRKVVAGVQTQLGTYTLTTAHVAGTFVRVRFKLDGTSLMAKGWIATATEPPYWQISATDSAFSAAGSVGARSITVAGNTNVNPVIRYDNLDMVTPQIMTVTRSVNGIVKAQAAGESIRLADQMIVAL